MALLEFFLLFLRHNNRLLDRDDRAWSLTVNGRPTHRGDPFPSSHHAHLPRFRVVSAVIGDLNYFIHVVISLKFSALDSSCPL